MGDEEPYVHLQMVWPERLLDPRPSIRLASGYTLRTYRPGDETGFFKVMERAGWPGWDEEKLRPWIARVPPGSWFMIVDDRVLAVSGH